MKRNLVLFAVCIQSNLMFSQNVNQKDTLRNIELPSAVIKNTRYNLLDEKNKLTISKQVIQQQNVAQDLPYILNGISSVVVSSDAGTGTGYTGIRIRGADLTRINVTMNGVPVNDAESQTTYFVDAPDLLSSTKEIEVNKGVGSSKNGVGSFGASIAINNLDVDNLKPYVAFQTDYGTFNTFKRNLKASTGLINERFITTVRLSNITSDGYIQRSASNLKGMQLTSKYLFNKKTQLVFNYMDGKEKTGQAWNGVPQDSLEKNPTFNELGQKSDGSFYKNQTDNYGQQYYQLFFDKKVNSNFSIGSTLFYTKGKGYYEEYKLGQSFADYHLPNFILNTDTISETDLIRQLWLDNDFYGGRVYANYLSKNFDAGLYINYNEYKGRHFGNVIWSQYNIPDNYQWYHLTANKKDMNVYGMFDYRANKNLSIFADIQARNVQYQIDGFRNNPSITQNVSYTFVNPKLKITWHDEKQIASFVAGITQKEPNRDDFEAGTSSLPKPEKLFNTELNYSIVFWKQLALQLTGFMMDYQDQLVLTGKLNDVGAYTRSNVAESHRAGIEFDATWKPSAKWFELSGNLSLSENKIKDFTEFVDEYDSNYNYIGQQENHYSNTDISFSPRLITYGQISLFPFRQFKQLLITNASFSMMSKYVGEQFLDNTSNVNRKMKAYATTDLLMNIPFRLKHITTFTLRGAMYNAFDKKYVANGYTYGYLYNSKLETYNYYYPQSGRRFMIGLGIEF